MPLAQPLAEFRRELQTQLTEDLPAALHALKNKLPEQSSLYAQVTALIGRLNDANKERFRNTITPEDYALRCDRIRADFFDLTAALTEADFDIETASTSHKNVRKQGSVLYRVPHFMPLLKPTRCTIRVALKEEEILENIILDENVEVKSSIEISDVMRAELVDMEGDVFQITPLNAAMQSVRESGYTEWLFNVMPRKEGVHELLVKVSILEIVLGFPEPIPREVSVLETVTITNLPQAVSKPAEPPMKAAGYNFTLQSPSFAGAANEISVEKEAASPFIRPAQPPTTTPVEEKIGSALPTKPPSNQPPLELPDPAPPSRGGMRIVAAAFAFLVLGTSATWAFTPPVTRDWWIASIKNNAASYATYLAEHPDSPQREKALFRLATATKRAIYYRQYLQEFNGGIYKAKAVEALKSLEDKDLQSIRAHPTVEKVRKFVADYPFGERLSEVKQAVEKSGTSVTEVLPIVENAYVSAIRRQQSPELVRRFLADFPNSQQLDSVNTIVAANPVLQHVLQSDLERVYLQRIAQSTSDTTIAVFLQKFPEPIHLSELKKVMEEKPQVHKEILSGFKRAEQRIREKALEHQ